MFVQTIVYLSNTGQTLVKQVYEVQVYDDYVIQGNTAVLKCHIPSFVVDYVVVTSWVRDMAFNIHTTVETGGQYMMMPTGELHIRDVTITESYKNYRCKTTHRLTGETKLSSTFGKLIVTVNNFRQKIFPFSVYFTVEKNNRKLKWPNFE
uniref:Ig-like domain-containing protein n=1 Tax=Strigamia maritima TaxID=126957 RepID=T1JLG8_STRMM